MSKALIFNLTASAICFTCCGLSAALGKDAFTIVSPAIGGIINALCAIVEARAAKRKRERYKSFNAWWQPSAIERKCVANIRKAYADEKKRVRVIRLALYHKDPLVRKKNAKRILKEDKKNASSF
jgi:hypothetical protein